MLDDDDDVGFDLFMQMSEQEQNAELARVTAEYDEFINAMTPLQYYRYSRNRWLGLIRKWRHAPPSGISFFDGWRKEALQRARVHLVKLRFYRATGQWPGSS